MTWQDEYSSAYMDTFGMPLLELVRGEGSYVWDDTGRRYLDLLCGIAVNSLGQAHPAIVDALTKQAAQLGHVSNFFTTPPQIELAQTLLRLGNAPEGSRVFLSNSGTEANEAAIKMALRHKPGGRMVALEQAFHGRTLGALSLTWKAAYREPYMPMTGNTTFVPRGDIDAMERELARGDVAGVFVEPIQGEAGVHAMSQEFMTAARELTRQYGALLVLDEVQSGAGRTGRWLAHEAYRIEPDVVTLAKGLGGGFPIGAVVGYGQAGSLFGPGNHGTTFGGNPYAAAVALAVIREVIPLLPRVAQVGEAWRAALAAVDGVSEVRGEGLLMAIEVERDSKQVQSELLAAGFITNNVTPTAIRIAPPFTISDGEAASFTAAISDVLR